MGLSGHSHTKYTGNMCIWACLDTFALNTCTHTGDLLPRATAQLVEFLPQLLHLHPSRQLHHRCHTHAIATVAGAVTHHTHITLSRANIGRPYPALRRLDCVAAAPPFARRGMGRGSTIGARAFRGGPGGGVRRTALLLCRGRSPVAVNAVPATLIGRERRALLRRLHPLLRHVREGGSTVPELTVLID